VGAAQGVVQEPRAARGRDWQSGELRGFLRAGQIGFASGKPYQQRSNGLSVSKGATNGIAGRGCQFRGWIGRQGLGPPGEPRDRAKSKTEGPALKRSCISGVVPAGLNLVEKLPEPVSVGFRKHLRGVHGCNICFQPKQEL